MIANIDQERAQLLDLKKARMDRHWRRREIGDETYLLSLKIMGFAAVDAAAELNLLKLEMQK